ncbi:EAL domain-containing protein [Vibrio sp. ZSDZ65]|uniref:EAL domain-containing protein n=2 Tax=Vibrio qingdaonensis TaxID=2829491 RepID=A0A9X3CLX7_9VIBR|nr:EAL domain-containing protein [Vibrio qingdaonensis]MCW8345579.1 EAL domain-containing protein [Vibrio qingdaonensis]
MTINVKANRLILLASLLLAAYLMLILGVTNLGQTRLEQSQHRELELKVGNYASTLEYFFYVTNEDMDTLVEDRVMHAFFANLASGMSMQYGLGSSILRLKNKLVATQKNKTINQKNIYDRFALVGLDGSIIADTYPKSKLLFNIARLKNNKSSDVIIRTVNRLGNNEVQLVKMVTQSGLPTAYLVAILNKDVIFEQLTAQESKDSQSRIELVSENGHSFVWDSLSGKNPTSEPNSNATINFSIPIKNTPFVLNNWFESVNGKSILTSSWFIISLSFLALPVMFGLFYIFIINNANIILRTKVTESKKQHAILSVKNHQLLDEIEKRKISEEKLSYQATHDALTGLPNRSYGNQQLESEIEKAGVNNSSLLVMFIDLDNFKQINDTLGHLAGDEVLKQSTSRLMDSVGSSELLSRLGGDEFLLIVPNLNNQVLAKDYATQVLALFNQPFNWNNQDFFVSISIGMSVYPQDGQNTEQLLANADMAMYSVKQDGRNAFSFYSSDMSSNVQRSLSLDGRLRYAIANNELEIYYQPILNLRTNEIIGAEALMRWNDKKFGMVPPDEFIPLSEKNGLIHQIGEFAIMTACQQAALWQAIAPIHMSINFSSVQFRFCDKLFTQVRYGLMKSGLPADRLDIEITESLLFNHNEEVISLLNKLQSMGVKLTIDDFGTGYSALSYLQKFPFDQLKIDRSFLKNIRKNKSDRELVNAVIAMAKALNLKVIAEGIENQWHVDYLNSIDCEYGQGFHYSKPVPAKEFERLLRDNANKAYREPLKLNIVE